jgi:LacI family transcriptional regulator
MQKIRKVILLLETSHMYGRGLLSGIAQYSRFHGHWVFHFEPGGIDKALPKLDKWQADGIITRDFNALEKLIAKGLPTIIVSHKKPSHGTYNIDTDDFAIATTAAEYFLGKGFKNFAYCGLDEMLWSCRRAKGFKERVAKAGFETFIYEQPKSKQKRLWNNEQSILAKWLKSLPKPVAVMTCADYRSQEVSEACKIADLRVPEEVAILGVDNDTLLCDLSSPSLSSIALSTEKAGYQAAELLDQLMNRQTAESQTIEVLPTHIITRHSTDILAIDDLQVAKAIRYIRQNSKKLIQVGDVVEATTLSRRSLERHFIAYLGRSILDEIRRVHVEQVAIMLTETNLSVAQIGLLMGYSEINNIRKYFCQLKGISPREYRKRYGQQYNLT